MDCKGLCSLQIVIGHSTKNGPVTVSVTARNIFT
jgi:hypothetical protein